MKIENNFLKGSNVDYIESPNHSGKISGPDTIIVHYTAGPSKQSAVNTFANSNAKVSAHLIIGTDGSITQMVPLDTIAWHAGKSQHIDRTGLNKFAIGIEIVNAGHLSKSGDKYVSWFGKEYEQSEIIEAVHRNETNPRYWHRYSSNQIDSVFDLCALLTKTYDIKYILGHEEISPKRKTDPGPAFPMEKLRDRVLGSGRNEDGAEDLIGEFGIVKSSSLNVRSEPIVSDNKIALPIPKDTKVKILEKEGGWYKIAYENVGWVSAKYIEIK